MHEHLPVQQSQVQPADLQGQVPLQPQAPSVVPQGQPSPQAAWGVHGQAPSPQSPPDLQGQPASHWHPLGPRQPAFEQEQGILVSSREDR